MENNINTGGPAFPGKQKAIFVRPEHKDFVTSYDLEANGMTLRDYFAAKAMQARLAYIQSAKWTEITAEQAYKMADAMLAERAK